MDGDRTKIELVALDIVDGVFREIDPAPPSRPNRWVPFLLLALVAGLIGWSVFSNSDDVGPSVAAEPDAEKSKDSGAAPDSTDSVGFDAVQSTQSIPTPLLAAELYFADPGEENLRELFDAVGGFEGLELAVAWGNFDLVSFDPDDGDRLLASQRLSYGKAENQQVNEIWHITSEGVVEQSIWALDIGHDFVHFNVDGTATMWEHGGGDGFAPRTATVLTNSFAPTTTTSPIYASRFTSADGTVFALTGNGDYYTNDKGYADLIADDGTGVTVLGDGSLYGWIDNPTPDILVAYPTDREGVTAVWDVATLLPLPAHQLAGRHYQRASVSGDGAVAVGATFDGELEALSLSTGESTGTFGMVEISRVGQPIALNLNGTIAVTAENTGLVAIWWVGAERPIASVLTDAGQPRWVSSLYAPISTSVISADARRVALRIPARGQTPSSWIIADTDADSWIRRACAHAGRSLTRIEAESLGLHYGQRACPD